MEFSVPRHAPPSSAAGAPHWARCCTCRSGKISLRRRWQYFCCGLRRASAWRRGCSVLHVRVGGNHLTLRRGLLFPVTRRIPLRFPCGLPHRADAATRHDGHLPVLPCTQLLRWCRYAQGGRGVPFRQTDAREAAVNRQRRFHIICGPLSLRYGLLCLVPMLQALLAFDLDSLWAALGRTPLSCWPALLRAGSLAPQPSGWRTGAVR